MDEFKLNEIKSGSGWWANKYGGQIGAKYFNAFNINYLDLALEWNSIRPYTYSHRDSTSNYSHYQQALAHPLGANFSEFLLSATYQFHPKWRAQLITSVYKRGEDPIGENWGGNQLLPNSSREMDFNNEIGQGITQNVFYLNLDLQFEIKPRLFLTIRALTRSVTGDQPKDQTQLFTTGVRWNIAESTPIF